jgi:hypothetical protein
MRNDPQTRGNAQTRGNPFKTWWLGAAAAAALSLAPVCAHAQSAQPPLPEKASSSGYSGYPGFPGNPPPNAPGYSWGYNGYPFLSWLDMVSASQHAQPSWMTPLVTVTPRLEQEFRFDFYDQQNGKGSQGNGQHIYNYGGPGGVRVEFIPAYDWEVILAAQPYETATGPKGTAEGNGDWPAFLVKYRFASGNEQNGNYIVTGFFQMSDPGGTAGKISNDVLVAQPTIAFGKGWGDFDIQSTLSQQYPVSAIGATPSATMTAFGDPILWNTTFQYHFLQYFWPELEVNYEYWPNGEHAGWNQVMLTPGIIFGRFKIWQDSATRPVNLIVGAGYQVAVTPNPVTQNNVVATFRVTF